MTAAVEPIPPGYGEHEAGGRSRWIALGLAVLATLSTTRTENLLASGDPAAAALTGGYHVAWIIGAGLVVTAVAVAATILRPDRTAEQETGTVEELRREEPAYSEAA